ncbi:OsmC family protein [Actinokineospora sp. 24-640]
MNATKLYSTAAVSRADTNRVEVDGADPGSLVIAEPVELGGSGGGWDPERLYAAALATCLHQSLVLVASTGGHDTTGSTVRAEVSLGASGAEAYELDAHLVVEIPEVAGAEARRGLVDQAVGHCPLAGGWTVTIA